MLIARARAAGAAALAAALSLAMPGAAYPHAVPLEYRPDPAASLAGPPREVVIRYSERVDPRGSSLLVLDASGARIDAGDAAVLPGDVYRFRVGLRAGAEGRVYTVAWRVLSADDGHFTEGTYVLAVGGGAAAAPAPSATPAAPSPLDGLGRILALTGEVLLAACLLGPAVFGRRWSRVLDDPRLATAGFAAALAGGALALADRALVLTGEMGLAAALALVVPTSVGRIWAVRVGLDSYAAAAALAATLLPAGGRAARALRAAALLCLAGGLVLSGLASHAATATAFREVALSAHAVHLGAAVVWLGGLAWFAGRFWATTRASVPLPVAIPAFSLVAVTAVGLLAVSGVYLARLEVASLSDLLGTAWGRVLAAKVVLFGAMLALAVYHTHVAYRRIMAASRPGPGGAVTPPGAPEALSFRRTLRLEAALGLAALGLAGLLATLSPPRAAATAVPDEAFRHAATVDGAALEVEIAPLRPGRSTVRLAVSAGGAPLEDAVAAMLLLEPADGAAAPSHLPLDRTAPGVFAQTGPVVGMAGAWRGKVVVQRDGAFDLNHRFEFVVPAGLSGALAGARPPAAPLDGVMLLVAVGVAAGSAVVFVRSRRDLAAASTRWGEASP